MKRTVALTILGVGVAAVTSAYGQGAFTFSNYYSNPLSPIVYDGGGNVGAGEGVVIELWAAQGADQPEGSLVFAGEAQLSAYAGYTVPTQVFTAGDITGGTTPWTVQFRASGTAMGQAVDTVLSRGPVVTLPNVGDQNVSPPELPVQYNDQAGFTVIVPEPTTFALAGLGAAALVIFRRRS